MLAAAEALLVKLALPGDWTEASDDHPVEMTQFIKNADIEEGANVAWTAEKPKGGNGPVLVKGIEGQSMEYWSGSAANGTFNYYQTIGAGLPEGKYQLTAQVANSYSDLLEAHTDHDTTDGEIGLYALTVDAEYYELVPTQVELCTEAWQQPVVTFTLREGQALTIGVKNYDTMTARWTVIDNFRLTYFGTDSQKEDSGTNGIETVQGSTFNEQRSTFNVYDLQGRSLGISEVALQHSQRKGSLLIVRQADGTVRKILVK